MCKAANESADVTGSASDAGNLRPRAYMYSIFFMMSMPPIAGGVIALGLHREIKRAKAVPA